jgi:uncharacterized protein
MKLNKRDEQGFTDLNAAVLDGDRALALNILSKGADTNIADNTGITPLMNAAAMCDIELVKALLKKGADKSMVDDFGDTAFIYAQEAIKRDGAGDNAREILNLLKL